MAEPFRLIPSQGTGPQTPWPENRRPLADRPVLAIVHASAGKPTVLRWSEMPAEAGGRPSRLRITVAMDHRQAHRVKVRSGVKGEPLGDIDILYSTAGEVFELTLSAAQSQAALAEGLSLSLDEPAEPLWVLAVAEAVPPAIRPHLLVTDRAEPPDVETFFRLFCSMATLQPCDWMETCVLDGLRDWSLAGRADAAAALVDHLDAFFPATGRFLHEDTRGEPIDDEPTGQENHGPMAVLAMTRPEHPALRITAEALRRQFNPDAGGVAQGRIVAETSYSVAYVMLAMALHAGVEEFEDLALQQLRMNRRRLAGPDDLWLRCDPAGGERTFANWSRGVAWYCLGLVRTLRLLEPDRRPTDLLDEVRRMAAWVATCQARSGLWPCYLKEPDVLPDTSGSAGIAAAVALGVRSGMLDASFFGVAERACNGLRKFLTPDGWLTGVSQSNKQETHAMDIQRSAYRVIGPWGMGLFAQLLAALDGEDGHG